MKQTILQRNLFELFVLWIIKLCLSCHIHFHLLILGIQICKSSDYVGDILGRNPNVSFLPQFLCMFLPGRQQSGPNIKKLFEPHLTWLLSWQGASAGWREGSVRQQPLLLFCQNSPEVALGERKIQIMLLWQIADLKDFNCGAGWVMRFGKKLAKLFCFMNDSSFWLSDFYYRVMGGFTRKYEPSSILTSNLFTNLLLERFRLNNDYWKSYVLLCFGRF